LVSSGAQPGVSLASSFSSRLIVLTSSFDPSGLSFPRCLVRFQGVDQAVAVTEMGPTTAVIGRRRNGDFRVKVTHERTFIGRN
jgi:hypothetical protein